MCLPASGEGKKGEVEKELKKKNEIKNANLYGMNVRMDNPSSH